MNDRVREKRHFQRIKDAGLVSRKVVGHPDDFVSIKSYSEKKYKSRGISLTHEYTPRCSCKACVATRREMKS